MFSALRKLVERKSPPPVTAVVPANWKSQGNEALARGALEEAQSHYRRGTEPPPGDPLAWLNLGYVQLEQGQHALARESLTRAAGLVPAQDAAVLCDVYGLLGRERQEQQDWVGAKDWFARVVDAQPKHAQAWYSLGLVSDKLGDADEALACMVRALAIQPDMVEAIGELSRLEFRRDRHEEALRAADRLLALAPAAPQSHFARARPLWKLGRLQESLEAVDKGLEHGQDVNALYLRGILLAQMGRHEQALLDFEQLQKMPVDLADAPAQAASSPSGVGRLDALMSKAVLLHDLGRYDEALSAFDLALAQDATLPELQLNRAYSLFLTGDYERAWAAYESRWKIRVKGKVNAPPAYGVPRWNGESLAGKTIVLFPEQGLGDAIQFMRYLPLVARDAALVLFQLHDALVPLATDLPGNCRLISTREQVSGVDYSCSLLSLPRVFHTTLDNVPARVPYVRAEPQAVEHWQARLGPRRSRLRVGLVWSGNRDHANDHNRSIPLESIRRVAPADVEFYSLQKELRETDQEALDAWEGLTHFGDELRTFMDTAALASLMDVVISVDTSVAHLAGALGRPLRLLLPFVPDWRWAVGRDDTPWYPTARLYRQPAISQWEPALRDAMASLQQAAGGAVQA
jgi:tetratricopeptide (TPR) repeat protein